MKTFKNIIICTVLALLFANCKHEAKPEVKTVTTETVSALDPNMRYAKAEFTVEGMTCAIGCAATIEKKIAKMNGVTYAKVDFEKKLAMVEFNESLVNLDLIEKTVTSVADAYKVTDMKTVGHFSVK